MSGVVGDAVIDSVRDTGVTTVYVVYSQATEGAGRDMVLAVRAASDPLGFGLIGAFSLTRFLKSLLYGVGPTDWTTFLMAALVLALTAASASYIPARRAANVDPMVALRYE